MKKDYLPTLVACIFLFASCKKNPPNPSPTSNADVYVAGWEWNGDGSQFIAKYWKNGTEVNLTDGTKSALAYSIAVSGNDVYVAGVEGNQAKYWKNSAPVILGDTSTNTGDTVKTFSANSIAVSGNDVYVAGYKEWSVANPVAPGQRGNGGIGGRIVRYWKNGNPVDLFAGSGAVEGENGIAVSGDDVYMAGYSSNGAVGNAIYWKDGIANTIGVQGSTANAIAVSGNDVYVAGIKNNSDLTKTIATYWKNGMEVTLGADTEYTVASSIAVSGNDIYVGGFKWNSDGTKTAFYWRNGTRTSLSKSSYSWVYGIAVSGNDVYSAGLINNGGNSIAAYWKNEKEILLSDSTKLEQVATGIFVVKK